MNITRTLKQLLLVQQHTPKLVVQTLRTLGRPQSIVDRIANENPRSTHPEPARHHQPAVILQHVIAPPTTTAASPNPSDALDIDWSHEMHAIRSAESRSILEPLPLSADSFDPSTAVPNIRPAHNLAAYVKKSVPLQQFIQLGVDLSRIERRKGLADFVLRLDWQRDIQPHLRFLRDVGVPADGLGAFVTRNPLIFKEDLAALQTRINYLQSKQFEPAQIARIVTANPFWLMFRTQRIDGRLGFFQAQFQLSGAEVRQLAVRQPRLLTYGLEAVRRNSFVVREELGFSADETKRLLLAAPKLWMMSEERHISDLSGFAFETTHNLTTFSFHPDAENVTERFVYVHETMGISHERIVQSPEVLYCRLHRLRERHGYLKRLHKAQYDPRQPLYVHVGTMIAGTDAEFALNVAESSTAAYEEYLRTL